jgi:hypothetical protein
MGLLADLFAWGKNSLSGAHVVEAGLSALIAAVVQIQLAQ